MAKTARVSQDKPGEPNLVLPLATSYNTRGVLGYAHAITNSEDQRKLNCHYEAVKNPMTGKGTLVLCKRGGVSEDTTAGPCGSTTQNTYLITRSPGATAVYPWVASKSGNDIRVSSAATTTVVATSANPTPAFFTTTIISGSETIVLQTREAGFAGAQRAFYSTTIATWTEISDVQFTTLTHRGILVHLDGYAFMLDGNSSIWNSDSNSIANWSGGTNFIAKQITQDLPVGLAKVKNLIVAFGFETLEVFYNGGNTSGSPLLPAKIKHTMVGLAAPLATATVSGGNYYCSIREKIFFVGRAKGGENSLGVFAFDGSVIEKVSTTYVDKIISEVYSTGNFTTSNGFTSVNTVNHHGQEAVSILLTTHDAATQRWLMFYPEWKEWFEWNSTVFSPINSGNGYHISCLAGSKNKVYKMPITDNWADAGTNYEWFTQFRLPSKGSARVFMPFCGVDADTDTTTNSQMVSISDDDFGTAMSSLGTLDLTQDRKIIYGGGSYLKRHVKIGATNARPARLHNFLAKIE